MSAADGILWSLYFLVGIGALCVIAWLWEQR
jgi:hypothetical protein